MLLDGEGGLNETSGDRRGEAQRREGESGKSKETGKIDEVLKGEGLFSPFLKGRERGTRKQAWKKGEKRKTLFFTKGSHS